MQHFPIILDHIYFYVKFHFWIPRILGSSSHLIFHPPPYKVEKKLFQTLEPYTPMEDSEISDSGKKSVFKNIQSGLIYAQKTMWNGLFWKEG